MRPICMLIRKGVWGDGTVRNGLDQILFSIPGNGHWTVSTVDRELYVKIATGVRLTSKKFYEIFRIQG